MLIDAKRPPKMYGSMNEHEVAEIYDFLQDDERLERAVDNPGGA